MVGDYTLWALLLNRLTLAIPATNSLTVRVESVTWEEAGLSLVALPSAAVLVRALELLPAALCLFAYFFPGACHLPLPQRTFIVGTH